MSNHLPYEAIGMKDNKTVYTLRINTNINKAFSTYERRYHMTIHKELPEGMLVSLRAEDFTITGYCEGDSKVQLMQNVLVKFKESDVNQNIAKLALKFDDELNKSKLQNSTIHIVKEQLEKISKTKAKALVI